MSNKTIHKLFEFKTFIERFEYLKLVGTVGAVTFGFDRYINQMLYSSLEWKHVRDEVMIRDNGCDLGLYDYPIIGRIVIHHMNPISLEAIEVRDPSILNPEFLITTSLRTHQAIHYGNKELLPKPFVERSQGDNKLW
jgi:hypothetical protein